MSHPIIGQDLIILHQECGVACWDLGVTHRDLGFTCHDLGVAHWDLKVAHWDLAVTRWDLGVAHQDLGVARRDLGVARQNLGVARRNLGVARRDLKSRICGSSALTSAECWTVVCCHDWWNSWDGGANSAVEGFKEDSWRQSTRRLRSWWGWGRLFSRFHRYLSKLLTKCWVSWSFLTRFFPLPF